MKIEKSHPSAASAAPHASVAAASYYELAIAHVRANGGQGVVVSERGAPAQWRAWLAYFAWLDDETLPRGKKARTFRSMTNGTTVPTAWPLEFDLSAPPAPAWEFDELEEKLPTPERRRELANMLRALVANVTLGEARAPTWRDMTPKTAEARLSELRDKYAGAPAQVNTPEMAAYLAKEAGVVPRTPEAEREEVVDDGPNRFVEEDSLWG
jgi:hypothetical protein